MANKKFSEFTLKTDPANVDFVVGYDGTDNVRIDPANLGGGGASDLNGLTDCLVDTASLYVGEVPSGLSGNPQGNTVLGIDAGNALTSATNNTFLGNKAGYGVTTAAQNTLIGYEAGMDSSLVAGGVVAIGYQAGKEFESGDGAVLVGRYAGAANGSAKQQTVFIGDAAGRYISSAFNTAVGAGALRGGTSSGSSAAYNTAVGTLSLKLITTGDNNVAIGANAGDALTTGSNNIIIGKNAAASAVDVSNEITLGDSSITALRCAVTSITSLSDERDKSEIKDLEYGLAFIDALQPREFVWDNRPETRTEYDDDGNETQEEFYSANKGKKDFGFIAQEVRELDNDTLRLVYTENEERLELSYGKLVPILVKAIQELKEEVELLKG